MSRVNGTNTRRSSSSNIKKVKERRWLDRTGPCFSTASRDRLSLDQGMSHLGHDQSDRDVSLPKGTADAVRLGLAAWYQWYPDVGTTNLSSVQNPGRLMSIWEMVLSNILFFVEPCSFGPLVFRKKLIAQWEDDDTWWNDTRYQDVEIRVIPQHHRLAELPDGNKSQ